MRFRNIRPKFGNGARVDATIFDDGALTTPLDPKGYHFFEGYLPTAIFLRASKMHRASNITDWQQWLQGEMTDDRGEEYWTDLTAAWLTAPTTVGPVHVLFDRRGRWDIGDGWHRIAMSVVAKQPAIYAIWGEPL